MAIRQAGVQGSSAVFAALLGLAAVVRVGVVLNRSLDADESQHLHAAWLVGQGQVPFRDFWEHHLPLFYYLLAPLTRCLPTRCSSWIERPSASCSGNRST